MVGLTVWACTTNLFKGERVLGTHYTTHNNSSKTEITIGNMSSYDKSFEGGKEL